MFEVPDYIGRADPFKGLSNVPRILHAFPWRQRDGKNATVLGNHCLDTLPQQSASANEGPHLHLLSPQVSKASQCRELIVTTFMVYPILLM
jgi:hypothetical protein